VGVAAVRARGGLLSASAGVAVVSSALLAVLIVLGLGELTQGEVTGGAGAERRTDSRVVVPVARATTSSQARVRPHARQPAGTGVAPPAMTTGVEPAPGASSGGSTAGSTTPSPRATATSKATRTTTSATRSATGTSPSPSPTTRHGNGNGQAKGGGQAKRSGPSKPKKR
jgi:hypothetical protein